MAEILVSPSGSYVFSCDQVSSDVPASLFPPSPLCLVVTKEAAAAAAVVVFVPTAVNVQRLMTQT